MSKFGKQVISSLRGFLRDVKAGKAIVVTQVRREETPDGPLHTFTKRKVRFPDPEKKR